MEFGTLIPQFGGPLGSGVIANKAPTAILLTNNYVGNNAANGTVVGYIIVTDPDEGQEHTVSISGPGATYLEVVGDELRVKASLGGAGATQAFTLTAEDGYGGSYSEGFTLQITSPDSGDDGGLSDGGFVVDDGFIHGPYNSPTQGGSTFNGKSSGKAIFLRNVGNLIANSKVSAVWTTDFSGMKNLGKNCAVGFGWRDGSDNFHVVALKGDGAGNVRLTKIYGSANFSGSDAGWTFTDLGAPTYNGTLASTFKLRVVVATNGSTYSVYTANTSYKNLDNWTLEASGQSPTPLANATTAATQFGLVLYTPKGDHGSFQIPVTWWREQHLEAVLKHRNGAQTYTAGSGQAEWQGASVNAYNPRDLVENDGGRYYVSFIRAANGTRYYGRKTRAALQEYDGARWTGTSQLLAAGEGANTYGRGFLRREMDQPNQDSMSLQTFDFPSPQVMNGSNRRWYLHYANHESSGNDIGTSDDRNWHYAEVVPKHWRGSLLRLSSNVAYPASTDVEATWHVTVHDDLGMVSGNRFVCPAALSGRWFRFWANAEFDDSTAATIHYINCQSQYGTYSYRRAYNSSGWQRGNFVTPPIRMTTNQYARFMQHHTGGGDRNMINATHTWFGAELLDENYIGCQVHDNGNTRNLNKNTDATMTYGGTLYDIGGWKTNTTTLTVPSGVTKVEGYILQRMSSIFGGYPWRTFLYKNGTSQFIGNGSHCHHTTSDVQQFTAIPPFPVSPGNTIQVKFRIDGYNSYETTQNNGCHFALWAAEHSR